MVKGLGFYYLYGYMGFWVACTEDRFWSEGCKTSGRIGVALVGVHMVPLRPSPPAPLPLLLGVLGDVITVHHRFCGGLPYELSGVAVQSDFDDKSVEIRRIWQ